MKRFFENNSLCKLGFALNLDLRILIFISVLFSCLKHYIELCFYMGLLQFALGLSKCKGESSNSAKLRENNGSAIET